MPANVTALRLHWPQGSGTLILRQVGVADGQDLPVLIGANLGLDLDPLTVLARACIRFGRTPWYRRGVAIPESAGIAPLGAWLAMALSQTESSTQTGT